MIYYVYLRYKVSFKTFTCCWNQRRDFLKRGKCTFLPPHFALEAIKLLWNIRLRYQPLLRQPLINAGRFYAGLNSATLKIWLNPTYGRNLRHPLLRKEKYQNCKFSLLFSLFSLFFFLSYISVNYSCTFFFAAWFYFDCKIFFSLLFFFFLSIFFWKRRVFFRRVFRKNFVS